MVRGGVTTGGAGEGHCVGIVRVLQRLCLTAKLEDITPHVLRRTFASVAGDLGFSELTIASLLGHTGRGVTQRYVHLQGLAAGGRQGRRGDRTGHGWEPCPAARWAAGSAFGEGAERCRSRLKSIVLRATFRSSVAGFAGDEGLRHEGVLAVCLKGGACGRKAAASGSGCGGGPP